LAVIYVDFFFLRSNWKMEYNTKKKRKDHKK
jgi:hypothetical protein